MDISETYRIDEEGGLLLDDTPHIHRKGIMNTMAVLTFQIADQIGTMEQFGLIGTESDLKKAIRLFYAELEREYA